jgi:lysine-ketoglutarate reductase/saccharopine dehydrogenase-like protein (TIGR00300 family)
MVSEIATLEGHLIDSGILQRAFARIVEGGGAFDVLEFKVGRTNEEPSHARLSISAKTPEALDAILANLAYLGATARVDDAVFGPAEDDGVLPDAFYSSTNFDTFVRIDGAWRPVAAQKMDCAIVLRDGGPVCMKQRLVRRGEPVLLMGRGVRVRPPERPRKSDAFGFMSHEISAETNKTVAIEKAAAEMRRTRANGERIVVVAGPAIVHSGGDVALARLVREGWVDALLAGNAFATHDLEKAVLKTSLGVCQMSGRAVDGGSRNHLFAINAVNRAGGVVGAVRNGLVRRGVMYELVTRGVPFVLAGSIRDDGPLKDVIVDVLKAQEAYLDALKDCGFCIMLATALHSIAVGNLLPARVRTVCVDIAEATPVKLANRGTTQAAGLVTDAGFFLERLAAELLDG